MERKHAKLVLAALLAAAMLAGCGSAAAPTTAPAAETAAPTTAAAPETTEAVVDDQAAADAVAELIDAIYVQQRTDDTDAQCAAAKARAKPRGQRRYSA